MPAIIEQKVTGQEAFGGFRRWSTASASAPRAAGSRSRGRLWVQPSPETLRAIPSWEWLRMHVDPARSRPIQHAARVASALERAGRGRPRSSTAGCARCPASGSGRAPRSGSRAHGRPDAVSFGDYHVAKNIG